MLMTMRSPQRHLLGYNTYRNNLLDAVDQTVSKNAEPKTVLTNLQKQADTILKDNK